MFALELFSQTTINNNKHSKQDSNTVPPNLHKEKKQLSFIDYE